MDITTKTRSEMTSTRENWRK